MSRQEVDLFVIGGGSGGVRAARMAAEAGARVALAEQSRMGGTCVIRGCVPKKLMVFAAGVPDALAEARGYGWDVAPARFDWTRFRAALTAELDRLEGVYRGILSRAGVEVFDQRATLAGPQRVRLADGREIAARRVLIATGGRPARLEVPGAELAMVSDDIFVMERLPETMLVLGGGYIACEMASIMAGLGVRVTLMHRAPQILRGFDNEARELVAEGLRARGITLVANAQATAITRDGDGLRVADTRGGHAGYGAVLMATGRDANTAGLGLAAAGVRTGAWGAVEVDDFSRTSAPSVWAVGDVTDRVNLTPVAIREAMAFVETEFRGNPVPTDHDLIPSAVFTDPEFGTVGLGEEDARAQEKVDVYATTFRPMRTAFAGGAARVMMKLVVSQATRRVLGCHIVAPGAGEMIQLAGIAVKMGATKEDFDRVCAVHPTMAEELVTMRAPVRSD
ncbi:MAG: glutathione-disulfide reductase [Rubellimicrobium sp.]|nr:glutathione-disulfide reductase [Rubellimicrobium sp.]